MNRMSAITATMGAALLPGIVVSAQRADAQSAKDVVGTWAIVAADTLRPDGSRSPNYGPDPKGVVMFDANLGQTRAREDERIASIRIKLPDGGHIGREQGRGARIGRAFLGHRQRGR
jgi:hypothetical protein